MITLGTPVRLNKPVQSLGWTIVEVTFLSKTPKGWKGRLILKQDRTGRTYDHSWNADDLGKEKWEIHGEGAWLESGERINSYRTYPFSLLKPVNQEIREEISRLINTNRNNIVEARRPNKVEIKIEDKRESVVKPKVVTEPAISNHESSFVEVLVSEIQPFEGQPRNEFTESDLKEISESLAQEGQSQVIKVTPISGVPGKKWELVDGERRYRGAVASGRKTLLAIVKTYKDKGEQFWDSFVMNWNRKDHTPMESSKAIARAISEGKSVKQIMVATGKSNCWVYQHMQLQKLDPSLQELMRLSVPNKDRLRLSTANLLVKVSQKDQIRIWEVAKREKTSALVKLKIEELVLPALSSSSHRGRKRKPSDHAARMIRVVRTAESDMVFVSQRDRADFESFVFNAKGSGQFKSLLSQLSNISEKWRLFETKVRSMA